MPTGQTPTDLEQNGRDTNILSHYFGDNVALEPIENYGRLGKLLYMLIESLLNGTVFRYGGRVDTVNDLPETGTPNEFYLVGPEDSENFDEYIWAVNEEEEHGGHWDRLGSVSIIIDDHLDPMSTNPVQNSVITLAINGLTVSLASGYSTTGSYVVGSYCTRGQTLYKSNAVQNPAGEWDSSKWDQVTVMGELTSVISGLATVARSGSYTDLINKPTIPDTSELLKQLAAAPKYDSTAEYADGDYVTYEGEFYKYDVNGSPLPSGPNLWPILGNYTDQKAFIGSSGVEQADTESKEFIATAALSAGSYTLHMPNGGHTKTTSGNTQIIALFQTSGIYSWSGTGAQNANAMGDYSFTVTGTSNAYLKMTIPKNYADQITLRAGSGTAKFTKVTLASVLGVGKKYTYEDAQTGNIVTGGEIFNNYQSNVAKGTNAHAEGSGTTANGNYSHAEGGGTTASNTAAHSEGNSTTASGFAAHAEGGGTTASQTEAHAEGTSTTASAPSAHAEGNGTTASGENAHAEGKDTTANGANAHAEGNTTIAGSADSHAQNTGTIASEASQTVMGKYNIPKSGKALIVGNGSSNSSRSNAFELDWNGNVDIPGIITCSMSQAVLRLKEADIYDDTATYALYDMCVESGVLYRCAIPVTTAEAFDSSKWEAFSNTNGYFYILPITEDAHTALLTKDSNTLYIIL